MNSITSHAQLINRLANVRVLVVGDLMLDQYYWGSVYRISPEAPVPVVRIEADKKTYRLGGSGNVAANLAGLGCATTIVGLVGEDEAAAKIQTLFTKFGIEDRCIADPKRPTTTKTRIMAGKQQVVRVDEEDGCKIEDDSARRVLEAVIGQLAMADTVILSDYGKGLLMDAEIIQTIIRTCNKEKIPVFIDPKGNDWQRYTGASCITPNTAELELATGVPVTADGQWMKAARDLHNRLSLQWLLVTRGSEGMALFGDDADPVNIAARAREVFDVSGAGDTVIATLAACVAAGMDFSEAAKVANTAAGIVVGKVGTWAVGSLELEQTMAYETMTRPGSTLWKVADVTAAVERLARWRRSEQRIVFTNGCFDLLHPGHVSLLHQARQLGDRLIVGLNTDGSIKRLKGPARPILPGPDRAAILSALEDVDMVVFFDEDTPLDLIERLKPDILVKGSDYRVDQVVGREVVESYGGQVRLVDLLEGYSTTAIAKKLANGD